MTDTITVASLAHTAVQIADPIPSQFLGSETPHLDWNKAIAKGEAAAPSSTIINGSNHLDAVNGLGITKGVDAGLFHRWLDGAKLMGSDLAAMIYEVAADGDDSAVDSAVAEAAEKAEPQQPPATNVPGTDPIVHDAPAKEDVEAPLTEEPAPVEAPARMESAPSDQIQHDLAEPAHLS